MATFLFSGFFCCSNCKLDCCSVVTISKAWFEKKKSKLLNLLYTFPVYFYLFEKKYAPIPIKKSHPTTFSFLLVGTLFGAFFVFTWVFLTVGQFDSFPYYLPSGTAIAPNDYLINVVRSYYLGATGEENYYHFFNVIINDYSIHFEIELYLND